MVEAVRHIRAVMGEIRKVQNMSEDELQSEAKNLGASLEILREVRELGRLPVVNFAAGGVATPSDAALMMQLGLRRSVRRVWDLQVRRPGRARQGHSTGRSPISTILQSLPMCQRAWASPWSDWR